MYCNLIQETIPFLVENLAAGYSLEELTEEHPVYRDLLNHFDHCRECHLEFQNATDSFIATEVVVQSEIQGLGTDFKALMNFMSTAAAN